MKKNVSEMVPGWEQSMQYLDPPCIYGCSIVSNVGASTAAGLTKWMPPHGAGFVGQFKANAMLLLSLLM